EGRHRLEQGRTLSAKGVSIPVPNLIVLFLKEISSSTAEADFALPRFPAHLTKSSSLADGRLPSRSQQRKNAVARRRKHMPVDGYYKAWRGSSGRMSGMRR